MAVIGRAIPWIEGETIDYRSGVVVDDGTEHGRLVDIIFERYIIRDVPGRIGEEVPGYMYTIIRENHAGQMKEYTSYQLHDSMYACEKKARKEAQAMEDRVTSFMAQTSALINQSF